MVELTVRKDMRLAWPKNLAEDGGMALRLGVVDPLERAERICVGGSRRRVRSKASGACGVLCLCGWFDASG
jgi:hypothetical protein